MEVEVDDLASFDKVMQERGSNPQVQQAMAGYTDLVESGYREIFRVA